MKKTARKKKPAPPPKPRPPLLRQRPVPLFPGDFAFCIADTFEEALEFACKKFLRAKVTARPGTGAGLVSHGAKWVFVCPRSYLMHGAIAHEMRHGVNNVLDYADVRPCHANDETGAYLEQRLTAWLYWALKKAGETVKLDYE